MTFLLFFLRCLAYFGGPVKDGTRSDSQLACEVAHSPLEFEIGPGADRDSRAGSKG